MSKALKNKVKLNDIVSVKDFGAVGDGVADDTAAIQAAATYAISIGAFLEIPHGTYSISVLTVTNGIRGIVGAGTIKGRGTAPTAVVMLGSAGNPVQNAIFTLKMDMSAGDMRAVQGYDTTGCTFTGCAIYGFTNSATLNHYGFWMEGQCVGNKWSDNSITLYNTPTQRGFGIALYGTVGTGAAYGGFFTGAVSRAQYPSIGNTITGNVIQYGSYAISLQAAEYGTVTGNYCFSQNHRSIYLANASWGNTISGNTMRDFTSTALLLGYGSSFNTVVGNTMETTVAGGEAAVNINTGSQENLIEGNKIRAASNYGVYVATDSINTSIIGNDIGQHYLAAIGVENDWESPRPTNAIFSRTNYEAPPSPYTAWSFIDLTGIVIRGNVIRAGYSGRNTAAISLAQITTAAGTGMSNIVVANNSVVSGDNIAYNFYMFEETDNKLSDVRVIGNDFHNGNTEISASTSGTSETWNDKLSFWANNKQLDQDFLTEEINFANGDTTPSVATNTGIVNTRLFQCANTGATSITMFDDSFENQEITVRLDSNTTIVHNNSFIRTKGAVNIVGTTTNSFVGFKKVNTVWFETWRNF